MARKVFFSFHFDGDYWRTQQVRNINALEGNPLCTPNEWEAVKRKGDDAIKKWIEEEMHGRSCCIVLVGAGTAGRKWVRHEIAKAWNDKKGVVGIRVHKLLDADSKTSIAGPDPFQLINLGATKKLSNVISLKDPVGADSKSVYATIANNIEKWIEEAIKIRNPS